MNNSRTREPRLKPLGERLIALVEDVAVDVERRHDRRVSQPLLDLTGVSALSDGQRYGRVSEGVKGQMG